MNDIIIKKFKELIIFNGKLPFNMTTITTNFEKGIYNSIKKYFGDC